ncbi:MAG: GerMN domain-containing protein [Eubacteriales bacterium]|nr:GerMN domain-containing protein [Eubacteriales bacterium]
MKKKIVYFLLFLCLIFMMSGCKKDEKVTEEEDGFIHLYYMNLETGSLLNVKKDMEFSPNLTIAVRQVIEELGKKDTSKKKKYKAVFNKQFSVETVSEPEEGIIVIDFGVGYSQMSNREEILFRAAVVKSLVQLDGIDRILFTVEDEPLTDDEGVAIGIMDDDTFVLDNDKKEVYDSLQTVTLYYSNLEGNGLVEVEKDLHAKDNESMESAVINALRENGVEGSKSPISENLVINRISVFQNTCYLDLSSDIITGINGVDDEIKIYSIVNSLISLERVSQVQFSVDGEILSNINEVSGLDRPLGCDYSLITDIE